MHCGEVMTNHGKRMAVAASTTTTSMADDHDILSQTIGSLHCACSPLVHLKAIIMIILLLPSWDPRNRWVQQTPKPNMTKKKKKKTNQVATMTMTTIRMKRTSGTTSKEGFSPPTKSQAKEGQIQLQEQEKQQKQEQQMWRIYGIEVHQKELPSNRRMLYTLSTHCFGMGSTHGMVGERYCTRELLFSIIYQKNG